MTQLDGLYITVVMRDILKRERRREDPILLRRIILFLADNISNSASAGTYSSNAHCMKPLGYLATVGEI